MELTKLPPEKWEKIFGIKIIDYDGWDRDIPSDTEKELTIYEFIDRVGPSMVNYNREFLIYIGGLKE
jgi:hypothetical protein